MKPSCLRLLAGTLAAASWLTCPGLAPQGFAQGNSPDAVQSSLLEALSLLNGGMLVPREHPPKVTRDGDLYRVRIPLSGLTKPPNAAIEAIARPLDAGVWDITSLTLPPSGTLPMPQSQSGGDLPGLLTFSIERQSFRAKVDPSLSVPSPFAAELDNVVLHAETGGRLIDETIKRFTTTGTLSGDADHRLNIRAQGAGDNLRIVVPDKAAVPFVSSIQAMTVLYDVEGLDRGQAERLRAAARAFSADRQAAPAAGSGLGSGPGTGIGSGAGGRARSGVGGSGGSSTGTRDPAREAGQEAGPGAFQTAILTPAMRAQLRAMIDASVGLAARVNLDETVQGFHFEAAGANHGDIGQVRVGLTGEARDGRLNAHLDLALNGLTLTAVPADLAIYLPTRIDVRPVVSGVQVERLMRLLRDATVVDADQAALWSQAMALLNQPDAHVGIDSLSLDSGPLRVEGSARMRPLAGGSAAFDIHLTARGLDAMIAAAQGNSRALQIMPMVFLAKGMARQQGDALVWDIIFADGMTSVNGTPIGQPASGHQPGVSQPGGQPPGSRPVPPANR